MGGFRQRRGRGRPLERRRRRRSCQLLPLPSPPQYKTYKVVYRRYAGLYFIFCVDASDNELLYLETIHLFVEVGAAGAAVGAVL